MPAGDIHACAVQFHEALVFRMMSWVAHTRIEKPYI
jgi:hypothetical protein